MSEAKPTGLVSLLDMVRKDLATEESIATESRRIRQKAGVAPVEDQFADAQWICLADAIKLQEVGAFDGLSGFDFDEFVQLIEESEFDAWRQGTLGTAGKLRYVVTMLAELSMTGERVDVAEFKTREEAVRFLGGKAPKLGAGIRAPMIRDRSRDYLATIYGTPEHDELLRNLEETDEKSKTWSAWMT